MNSRNLWANSDFTKLWSAKTVSDFGSMISGMALPLTALLMLGATPLQMGILGAAGELPLLLIGLPAGVWVDRIRRRPVLIISDLSRALLLISVPIAALFGNLTIWQLYIVAASAGVFTVMFNVADQSYLPSLVEQRQLVEGNSKLGASNSLAEITGPPLGGLLVQIFSGPFAVLLDALSFLVSAILVGSIKRPEPPPTRTADQNTWFAVREGMGFVVGHPLLRALAGSAATATFFGNFIGVLYTLFIVRELGLTPLWVGILVGAGGAGALVGAAITTRTTFRFGIGPVLCGSTLVAGGMQLILPFVSGPPGLIVPVLLAVQFTGDIAWAVSAITTVSLRQSLVPVHMLGRANASTGVLVGALSPAGALLAGALAVNIGVRPTLFIGVIGLILASLWLVLSPVRTFREQAAAEGAV